MTFDREVAVFLGLLALCAILVLMILHISGVVAAPSVKCQATPPQVNEMVAWRTIGGRRCWYIGPRKIDKSLLYWEEPKKPLEIEEMLLPSPAPAVRAQSDFEDRWLGLINRENLLEPTRMEQWK